MSQDPETKIIIDEDWKSQVERERAEAEKPQTQETAAAPDSKPSPDVPLPPASLIYLATTLFFQAMNCLGLMPDQDGGTAEKNLPLARHCIDLLEVLQKKTEGNRTPDETADLDSMLYQLRMAYVQSQE